MARAIRIDREKYKDTRGLSDVVFLTEEKEFDIVSFVIDEIDNYYWCNRLGVASALTDSEVEKVVNDYCAGLKEEQIKSYKDFCRDIDEWGAD